MVSSTGPHVYAKQGWGQGGLATDKLRQEHEAALRVLKLLDRAVVHLKDDQKINPFFFEEVIDFLQLFVVCAHHAKEEEILFPFLKEKCIQEKDVPIETIHQEHYKEHQLIAQMEKGFYLYKEGSPAGREFLIEVTELYTHIARRHIMKENTLFMLADEVLSPEDQAKIRQDFDNLELQKLYEGTAERLKELVNELERQAFHW